MTFACKFCWLSTIIFLCLCYRILELRLTPLVIFELLSHRCVVLLTISVLEILLRHNLRFACYPRGLPYFRNTRSVTFSWLSLLVEYKPVWNLRNFVRKYFSFAPCTVSLIHSEKQRFELFLSHPHIGKQCLSQLHHISLVRLDQEKAQKTFGSIWKLEPTY